MLLFLPLAILVYFTLNKFKVVTIAKLWLVAASVFFYGYWNFTYVPLILSSIVFNYYIGRILGNSPPFRVPITKKAILIFGLTANLMLLAYYKYSNFLISNLNLLHYMHFNALHVILPLGISFFTFTQIAFLVDSYKGLATEYDFLRYVLFVTFFPHLIAGPIIHHKEMMPQFARLRNHIFNHKNFLRGMYIFSIGLFKKVVIADTLSLWANNGFDKIQYLSFVSSWTAALSYTFQLYFDFSGYCDMAIGAALLFNIWLPFNFDSPYRALNVQEFWRRWHMTLSRFLREYVYIPLGGNKKGNSRTYINLITTFMLGGIWHGAGYTFIVWGIMHGFAISLHRRWQKTNAILPPLAAWMITFLFTISAWVFFRAHSIHRALEILKGMISFSTIHFSKIIPDIIQLGRDDGGMVDFLFRSIILAFAIVSAFSFTNTKVLLANYSLKKSRSIAIGVLIAISLIFMNTTSQFLYFDF